MNMRYLFEYPFIMINFNRYSPMGLEDPGSILNPVTPKTPAWRSALRVSATTGRPLPV